MLSLSLTALTNVASTFAASCVEGCSSVAVAVTATFFRLVLVRLHIYFETTLGT